MLVNEFNNPSYDIEMNIGVIFGANFYKICLSFTEVWEALAFVILSDMYFLNTQH